MDVPSPAWSAWQRARCLLNTAFAVMLLAFPSTGLRSECNPSINIPKNSKVSQSEDQSLVLRCPVSYCSQELPEVTWCKTESDGQCNAVEQDHRISFKWERRTENKAVHVLKIDNFQTNDTGFYKCSLTSEVLQIMGSIIEVTSSAPDMDETTTITMPSSNSTSIPNFPSLEQFKSLVYAMASAGGLCVLIIIVSLIVFCHRRRRGKRSSSIDPKSTEEVQFFSTSKSPEKCLEHAEISPQEIITVSTETTYDNAHLGNRPSLTLSPEDDDSIVYADLNHNAKKMLVQFEAENEVEYATVCMT